MPVMNMLPGGSTLQIPLDAPTSLAATAGNAQVELTWTDPKDKYATPEGEVSETGDQLVSEWDHTVLVRKTGSQPAGPDDGTVVVSSSVRNQYQTTPYTDSGLTNDTLYYYGVFSYNKDGVASPGAFTSATPKAGTPLSELTEGTIIKINENGSPVEFYLAKHNYEPGLNGQGRELVVRKDCSVLAAWNSVLENTYATSSIDSWCNGSYKSLLSPSVQSLIGATKFYYTPGDANVTVTTLERSVFILSLIEYGLSDSDANREGTTVPIAAILKAETNVDEVWTRTPSTDYHEDKYKKYAWSARTLNNSTFAESWGTTDNRGYRPAFTLPSTALVTEELELVEG